MRPPAFAAALVGTLLTASCPCAQAQTEPPRTPALEAATERFESGKRLFREGKREHDASKIERAYFEFKAAFAIYPGRGTLLNLVETELATRRELDAMKHVREYVRSFGVPDEHSEYRRAFDLQSESAFKATGHLEIVGPPSRRVVVDGKDEALLTPLSDAVDVSPGRHVVDLVGSETLRAEANAGAGAVTRVAFEVAAPPPPVPTPTPLSGGQVATAPVESTRSAASMQLPMDVPPPRATSLWTPTRVWGAVVGVAGLVTAGAGFVFGTRANQDADRASSLVAMLGPSGCTLAQSQGCSDLQSAHDDQSRDHELNLALVGVGAAAVVTGAVLMLWPAHASGQAAFVPHFSAQGVGLELRGNLER